MKRRYRDRAIVLAAKPLGEADRIITLFTRRGGAVDVVAKGVRRPGSKFGSSLEPFTVIEALFYGGRSIDGVSQAEILTSYGSKLIQNTEAYIAANVIAEMGKRLGVVGDSAQQFDLLRGALLALAREISSSDAICSAYLLRALSLGGWEPALEYCAKCLSPLLKPSTYDSVSSHKDVISHTVPSKTVLRYVISRYTVDIPAGGFVCANCSPSAPAESALPQYLLALKGGDWPFVNRADESLRKQARNFVFSYTQWHIDNPLRSIKIISNSVF